MSARKRPLALGPLAALDLSDILLQSEQQWDRRQRFVYKALLDRALARLAEFPDLGRPRGDLRPGLRSFPVGQHVIFYRLESDAVRVDRILHAQRDVDQLLAEQ